MGLDILKASDFEAGILSGAPVAGLRPSRADSLFDRETAKTIDDDIVATFCGLDDLRENRIDDFFGLRFGKVIGFRDGVYEFSCIQVFILQ